MTRIKRFLLKTVPFWLILAVVAGVNYFVDPGNVFGNENFEKRLAAWCLTAKNQGRILEGRANYDERYFQKAYVDGLKEKRDVLVFGSSTVMGMSSDLFPGKSFLNAWVSAAGLNDEIAIYGLYRQAGHVPAVVVLAVDPWLLDKFSTKSGRKWERLKDSYDYMAREMGVSPGVWSVNISDYLPSRIVTLFSFSYFQSAVEFLREGKGKLSPEEVLNFPLSEKRFNENTTLWVDGSRTAAAKQRDLPAAAIEAQIIRAAGSYLNRMWTVDRDLLSRFEKFLALLKKDGVKVIVFLPPHQPLQYKLMNDLEARKGGAAEAGQAYERIESAIRLAAGKAQVVVVGSYDPQKAGVSADQFMDEMHVRSAETFRPMFNEIKLSQGI